MSLNLEEKFFVIDSNNLKSVETKFYGYTFNDYKIVKDLSNVDEDNLNSDGCYVYIKRDGNKIIIKQDFLGCYGLYLFQDKDYFAISNSFQFLVDYVKKLHKITFNEDYASAFLSTGLCSLSYSETLINEIRQLDRCTFVEIDILNKSFKVEYIDYQENSIYPDSKDGLKIIDEWYIKWSNIIRNCSFNHFALDLSGGIDSRLSFLLYLGAKSNSNSVCIRSDNDKLHCHEEDFEIATQIANRYGLTLNDRSCMINNLVDYNADDQINASIYSKMGFQKLAYGKRHYKCRLSGYGGELIRKYWSISKDELIDNFVTGSLNKFRKSSKSIKDKLKTSTEKVLKNSFFAIENKYKILNKEFDKSKFSKYLYLETRNRYHFGKSIEEAYIKGAVILSPFFDANLLKLKTYSKTCSDENFLIALIFDRYSDLLDFKIQGGRTISEDTIYKAHKINEETPFDNDDYLIIDKSIENSEDIEDKDFYSCEQEDIDRKYKEIFCSKKIKSIFIKKYGWQMYYKINRLMNRNKFNTFEDVFCVLSIVKALEDVEINEFLLSNAVSQISDFDLDYKKIK